jgi:hypothetical protein
MNGSGESIERSTCDSAAKIHHGVDLVVGEQAGDEVRCRDVSLREDVARIVREVGEIGGVTGVGEQVEVDDSCRASSRPR